MTLLEQLEDKEKALCSLIADFKRDLFIVSELKRVLRAGAGNGRDFQLLKKSYRLVKDPD